MTLMCVRKNALGIQKKAFHIDLKYVGGVCASLLEQSATFVTFRASIPIVHKKASLSLSLSLSLSFTYLQVRVGDVDSHLSSLHIHVFCFFILSTLHELKKMFTKTWWQRFNIRESISGPWTEWKSKTEDIQKYPALIMFAERIEQG
jgi:hypothetical protein